MDPHYVSESFYPKGFNKVTNFNQIKINIPVTETTNNKEISKGCSITKSGTSGKRIVSSQSGKVVKSIVKSGSVKNSQKPKQVLKSNCKRLTIPLETLLTFILWTR